jgi:hypothetical protein
MCVLGWCSSINVPVLLEFSLLLSPTSPPCLLTFLSSVSRARPFLIPSLVSMEIPSQPMNLGFTNIYTRIMGIANSHNNNINSSSSDASSTPVSAPGGGARNVNSSSSDQKSSIEKKHETPVMDFVEDLEDEETSSEEERRYQKKNHRTNPSNLTSNGLRRSQQTAGTHLFPTGPCLTGDVDIECKDDEELRTKRESKVDCETSS